MSFTDQKQRIATEQEVNARWGGDSPGKRFRCYICGEKFQVGDKWRWVCITSLGIINCMVCDSCDVPDIRERWKQHHDDIVKRGWWLIH